MSAQGSVSSGRREIERHIWLRINDLKRGRYLTTPDTVRFDAVTINSVSTKSGAVQWNPIRGRRPTRDAADRHAAGLRPPLRGR